MNMAEQQYKYILFGKGTCQGIINPMAPLSQNTFSSDAHIDQALVAVKVCADGIEFKNTLDKRYFVTFDERTLDHVGYRIYARINWKWQDVTHLNGIDGNETDIIQRLIDDGLKPITFMANNRTVRTFMTPDFYKQKFMNGTGDPPLTTTQKL